MQRAAAARVAEAMAVAVKGVAAKSARFRGAGLVIEQRRHTRDLAQFLLNTIALSSVVHRHTALDW